jgi:multicomponent Na+:H+ antiporter subunit D
MSDSNLPLLIPFTFLVAALLVPLAGSVRRWASQPLAVAACLFSLGCSVAGMARVFESGTFRHYLAGWQPPIGIEFVFDPLAAFFLVMITGVGCLVLIYSGPIAAQEIMGKRIGFYSLAMLLLAGLTGMVVTGDLFNLYVFLEISALASYALVAIGDPRAPYSAFRYLTLGTVGASLYLMGLAFLYMSTGTLNMAEMAVLLPYVNHQPQVVIGIVLILLGAGLKMALFPMHAWLPDAYTNASSPATALIAPIGTKVAVYLMIRVLIISGFPAIITVISWVAAVGIIAGSILAIAQSNLKRMLAYSSVANIGYIVLGVSLANPLAFIGAVLHILNHALMKAVLFMSAGGIFSKLGTLDILQLRGLPKKMPFTTTAFLIAVFSMVGIPPTGGFFSKIYLIFGAIEASAWVFVAAILISTLLNFFYFFRVIEFSFFKPYAKADDPAQEQKSESMKMDEMSLSMLLSTLILSAAIVMVGVYNGEIVDNFIARAVPGF